MVLSSFSPLFILWAIRGNNLVPDAYLIGFCATMVALPNVFLLARIQTARRQKDTRELRVGRADDHRDHILVYLFAILLPLYAVGLGTWRYVSSALAAFAFIVFLFWHLNLHYMNLLFAVRGYRVFTLYAPADGNPVTGRAPLALITRRVTLPPGERLVAYRLSNSVYLEMNT
jgi:hypothetical protein